MNILRSTIGKEGIIPYGAKVVLAYSGGPASTAMVKLLGDTLKETKKKANLNFDVKCVTVDLSFQNSEATIEFENMKNYCSKMGFELYVVSAKKWFADNARVSYEDFMSISDNTLKLDRQTQIIRKILTDFACEHNFDWLMIGQSLFRSAVNALTQVCQGRGADLGSICKFSDSRMSKNVSIVFPMKEFTSKEVAFFNQFENLKSFKFSDLETGTDSNSSIQRLTEHFLLNLQIDFPAAAPNARNSGDKIVPRSSDEISAGELCSLCLMPFDSTVEEAGTDNARVAASFSQELCNPDNLTDRTNKFCTYCKLEDIFG